MQCSGSVVWFWGEIKSNLVNFHTNALKWIGSVEHIWDKLTRMGKIPNPGHFSQMFRPSVSPDWPRWQSIWGTFQVHFCCPGNNLQKKSTFFTWMARWRLAKRRLFEVCCLQTYLTLMPHGIRTIQGVQKHMSSSSFVPQIRQPLFVKWMTDRYGLSPSRLTPL